MTTRITLAILLTTWVILIIGETAAFVIARQSLTAVLDDPIIITYSRPATGFNALLSQLAIMLLMISLACGLTTAWLALKLSRAALRPLRETADTIADIDEAKLARRIDVNSLPVELQAMTE